MSFKKVFVSLILSLGVFSLLPSMGITVEASRESELRSERTEIQSELKEKREELEALQAELVELEDEIEIINEIIESNELEIEKTVASIRESEEEIAVLEEEIEKLEIDIQRRHDILKDRASALQKNGGTLSYIDVLFGAQSFSDLIDRVSVVTKIAQSDQNLIQRLQEDQDEVASQRQIVEEKLVELENAKLELEHIQELTFEQKEINEAKQVELEEKKETSEQLIQELEIEDRELQQMIEQARLASTQNNIVQYSNQTASSSTGGATAVSVSSGASGDINTVINAGNRYLNGNTRYKYAGGRTAYDVENGLFDCSGYVSWAFRQAGVSVSASTAGLSSTGTKVSTSEMQPGDMVFFNTYKTDGHVGIYVGNNKFIGSQSSTGVAIADMNSSYWSSRFTGHVRRVIN
ncbi:NlpC/P60 family protein [Amphibacillus indicireducens]|uniref:Peptidoglycan DL-endopeptidase CwlO n=1 Tax=Amphibacillus indicireducens TaxID=1076330 RepID=A0ABP7VRD1_9BACI